MLKLLTSKSGRDYLFTFAVELFVVASTLFVYRLASTTMGDEGFSEYAITRRILSTLQPFLILGMGVAVPRFVSMSVSGLHKEQAGSYFYAALGIACISALVFLGTCAVFPAFFSYVFFGDVNFTHLIMPLGILVCGSLLHIVSYGYYRGRLNMGRANLMQFINLGLVPLCVFFFLHDARQVLTVTGLLWIGISGVSLALQLLSTPFHKAMLGPAVKELMRYGIPRVPGDFLLGLYFSLPVILVNHSDNVIMGGYISVALTFLNMAGAVFTPICLMLLTDTSQLIVKKDFEGLRRKTNLILKVTIGLTIAGVVLAQLLAPFIIHSFLKIPGDTVVFASRLAIIAALGYTLYISLRSVLDAYYVKPVNTVNIAVCVCAFTVAAVLYQALNLDYVYILCCFIVSMFLLGFLTWRDTARILSKHK